eukprot:4492735-Pyramimonas_sp.AAC.1
MRGPCFSTQRWEIASYSLTRVPCGRRLAPFSSWLVWSRKARGLPPGPRAPPRGAGAGLRGTVHYEEGSIGALESLKGRGGNIRSVVHAITVTNQSIYCRQMFRTRRIAQEHALNAILHTRCPL